MLIISEFVAPKALVMRGWTCSSWINTCFDDVFGRTRKHYNRSVHVLFMIWNLKLIPSGSTPKISLCNSLAHGVCLPCLICCLYLLPLELSLIGTRHPSHPSAAQEGGARDNLPRVCVLIEVELWFKNQRTACPETKPLMPKFKVMGQPLTNRVDQRGSTVWRHQIDSVDLGCPRLT